MFPMAEVHETGDLVHAHPFDLVIVLSFMAFSAHLGFRKRHALARVWIGMAFGALQFQIARVQFVAVRYRLLLGQGGGCEQDGDQEPHSAAVRICSAI
jgi:hypothetical protein